MATPKVKGTVTADTLFIVNIHKNGTTILVILVICVVPSLSLFLSLSLSFSPLAALVHTAVHIKKSLVFKKKHQKGLFIITFDNQQKNESKWASQMLTHQNIFVCQRSQRERD